MRKLHLDLAVYAFIIACGAMTIWQTSDLPESLPGDLGSAFFPQAMAVIMMALCVVGAVTAIANRSDERIVFEGGFKLIVTIAATALFFGLWSAFGYFYQLAFLFLFGLLTFYASDQKLTAKIVVLNAVGSAIFIALAYLFFTEVLYTRF